jgi:hypothetical protein
MPCVQGKFYHEKILYLPDWYAHIPWVQGKFYHEKILYLHDWYGVSIISSHGKTYLEPKAYVHINRVSIISSHGKTYLEPKAYVHINRVSIISSHGKTYLVTSIKRSPFTCPVIENFIWIELVLRGHLFTEATFWPLNSGLTVLHFLRNWWQCSYPSFSCFTCFNISRKNTEY